MTLPCFKRSLKLYPAGGLVLGMKFRGCYTLAIATSSDRLFQQVWPEILSILMCIYKSRAGTLSRLYYSDLGH